MFGFEWVRHHFQWSDCLTLGVFSAGLLFVGLYTKGHILNQEEKRKAEEEQAKDRAIKNAITQSLNEAYKGKPK